MANRFRARLGGAWRLMAQSLAGRLLLLTLLYVMVGEVLIFVPSIGRYYSVQLDRHIEAAEIAILPFTETGGEHLSPALRRQLLTRAGAAAVMLKRPDQRELFLADEIPSHVNLTIDLGNASAFDGMYDALDCLFFGDDRVLAVISPTRIRGAQTVEVVTAEGPIRDLLIAFARRLLLEAALTSLATALLVFFSLYFGVVQPMERLMRAMVAFRKNPEDPSRIIKATSRRDEIGHAERELAAMQGELYGFLRQKARLAALGVAVAKIQHDLRNILASAQLASDRLTKVEDPVVQRLALRVVSSLDRAVALAANTLRYGRADEHPPARQRIAIAPVVQQAIETVLPGEAEAAAPAIDNLVDPDLIIDGDPEQLYRIVLNILRNAVEILAGKDGGRITIAAWKRLRMVGIDVEDNGPGIPEGVRQHLFQAFAASQRPGGSGLGLAIARDLARAHGGDVTLERTSPEGTLFRVAIPDRMER